MLKPARPVVLFLLAFAIVAFAQGPPKEAGQFREPELRELVKLDPTIKLDIRYANRNNFLGRPVYKEARAFLQKPAAEALVRAHQKLREKGYGIVVFDGYRPWSVTKIFWDVTPQDKKIFVADPSQGRDTIAVAPSTFRCLSWRPERLCRCRVSTTK